MTPTADLILTLFPNAKTAEDLAKSLLDQGIVTKHQIKYCLIYNTYLQYRSQGETKMNSMIDTSIDYNISVSTVQKVRRIMENEDRKKSIGEIATKI